MTAFGLSQDQEDALIAGVDLVGRSGGTDYEVGYLYDDENDPAEFAVHGPQWWARAQYRGARLIVEEQPDPVTATDRLARRILTGAQCNWCKLAVWLPEAPTLPNRFGTCRWERIGQRWERGCRDTHPPTGQRPGLAVAKANRQQRRQAGRRRRG